MKTTEIKTKTLSEIRKVFKGCVCKNKQKRECDFARLYFNRKSKAFNCYLCPIKCLDMELKNAIEKKKGGEENEVC